MQLIDFKRRNYHTLRMFPQSLNPSKISYKRFIMLPYTSFDNLLAIKWRRPQNIVQPSKHLFIRVKKHFFKRLDTYQRRRCQIFTQKCGRREALYNVRKSVFILLYLKIFDWLCYSKDGDAKFSLRNVESVKLSIMSKKCFHFALS